MTRACLVCLEEVGDRSDYHPRCLRRLFGAPVLPAVDVELAKLHTIALAMVGKTSLSGVQRKISLRLSGSRRTLQLAVGEGRYILKPQSQAFPALPENEHVTMRLAELLGIATAPYGLLRLRDGSLAYITERFDRPRAGGKLRQEDFCQLAEKPPKEKYAGSAELCARIVKRFAAEPLIELVKLLERFVFAWWTGNGDMHLKNFSLLAGEDGLHKLSPTYDQLSTRLVIPDDDLALPISGKKGALRRGTFLELASYCGIPQRIADRILDRHANAASEARGFIERSSLGEEMKRVYAELVAERSGVLRG
jgi:serine/threonine-protein kinase HipA